MDHNQSARRLSTTIRTKSHQKSVRSFRVVRGWEGPELGSERAIHGDRRGLLHQTVDWTGGNPGQSVTSDFRVILDVKRKMTVD